MADSNDFQKNLADALAARADWLEKSELTNLKEELRTFHTAFAGLYNLYLKKGLINEDPYKNEVKIGELAVPETGPFEDTDWIDQYSIRLSHYDSQMDFLVNFYQFSIESLTMEKIKCILGLVRFIDWTRLTNNSESTNTKSMVELLTQAKAGADPLSISIISESQSKLAKTTGSILSYLKTFSDYNREAYKFEVRTKVLSELSPTENSVIPIIKKKFAAAMPRKPFYPDLVEEIIKENSNIGQPLRDAVLKGLETPDSKPKVAPQVSFKGILIDGLNVIGSSGLALGEIGIKLDENAAFLEGRKNGVWDKFKRIIQQMLNKEPDPTIFNVEYIDPIKGVPVKEKVDFFNFREEINRKIRTLTALSSRNGAAYNKMQSMNEDQLIGMLEKNIRDMQTMHKLLSALDDFFKLEVGREDRERIKGIRPELATIKNAIVKANQRRHEYSAQKEEEEQLKRLGISSES